MADRREFLKHGAAAAAVLAVHTKRGPLWESPVFGMVREDASGAAADVIGDPPAIRNCSRLR